jgi:membrane-anchored protein YejM (alkaline phosphatase superfamily)
MVDARRHYSSSNCTHFGLFSLFYGLNPYYFHDARVGQIPSAAMVLLSQSGYDIYATVSRSLQWYDMDRFMFGGRQKTYEPQYETGIERDRAVTDRSIELAINYQRSNKRYLNFVYYYATHADYQHPPEITVFEPELKGSINFASSDLRDRRDALLNRYRNSIRFIDEEVQRLVVGLKKAGAWDDTILVFTGDHGEEFFEEGRFGHNSSLNRFQTHVPFLMHIPGVEPRRIEWATSHTDVIGTLLNTLKAPDGFVVNVQGRNMLSDSHGPIYIGQAHYQRPERYAIVDNEKKLEIDLQNNLLRMEFATDLQGHRINVPTEAEREVLGLLQQFKAFRN